MALIIMGDSCPDVPGHVDQLSLRILEDDLEEDWLNTNDHELGLMLGQLQMRYDLRNKYSNYVSSSATYIRFSHKSWIIDPES